MANTIRIAAVVRIVLGDEGAPVGEDPKCILFLTTKGFSHVRTHHISVYLDPLLTITIYTRFPFGVVAGNGAPLLDESMYIYYIYIYVSPIP